MSEMDNAGMRDEKRLHDTLFVYAFHAVMHGIGPDDPVDREKIKELLKYDLILSGEGSNVDSSIHEVMTDKFVASLQDDDFRQRLFDQFPKPAGES